MEMLPAIRMLLGNFKAPLFKDLYDKMDALEDIYGWIHSAIEEEPPISVERAVSLKTVIMKKLISLDRQKPKAKTGWQI